MLMIDPGTTPDIGIELPVNSGMLEAAFVTFMQGSKVVFEKSLDAMRFEGKKMILALSQEETLSFEESTAGEWQIRYRVQGDKAFQTVIMPYGVGRVLKKGVI